MQLIEPSFKIESSLDWEQQLLRIEKAARTCYKSEGKLNEDGTPNLKFLTNLLHNKHHESVFEHSFLTVRFIVDRGVSHELVRHRLASYSQESTRYCRYANEVVFIKPWWFSDKIGHKEARVMTFLSQAEETYKLLLESGLPPQDARCVLPNATKTEIVTSANFREWRHILKLRVAPSAHPEMKRVMIPLWNFLTTNVPVVFDF